MITWWHYLLLVNIYLILFFVFYKLFLGKETFFQLNRVYLVAGSFLSFFIPLIQADWVRNLFITQQIHQKIYASVSPEFIYQIKPVESTPITLGQVIAIAYLTGASFLLLRLAWQLLSLKQMMNRLDTIEAFSFFKTIRVNPNLSNKQIIMAHEEVHTRQWHSADVLFIETVMIINWFNPIVYLYSKAIKHVHEFIADKNAINNGTSPAEYALLLVSQTFGAQPHQLTNNFFNHSLLKKRIQMLNQNPSNRRALLKYGLSAPLFACMLILSSATVNNSVVIKVINRKTDQALAITSVTFSAKADCKPAVAVNVKTVNSPSMIMATPTENSFSAKADTIPKDTRVFTAVEINPDFPGGDAGFSNFLATHIRYPDEAKRNKVSGKVFISFIVEKDGSLSNMKIVRDPGSGLGEESLRVLATSPKWKPGIQNGRTVRVQYTVPVSFTLIDDNTTKKGQDTVGYVSPAQGKPMMITLSAPPANIKQPLYLLNGKKMPANDMNKLKTADIESIEVIKADSAKVYGDAGKNGVVIIKLKELKAPGKN